MRKATRLYLLIAVSTPLSVSSIALAWAGGNLVGAIAWVVPCGVWTVVALRLAKKAAWLQTDPEAQSMARNAHRRARFSLELMSLVMLLVGVIGLAMGVFLRIPLDFTLFLAWLALVNGSEFLFVRVLTDASWHTDGKVKPLR